MDPKTKVEAERDRYRDLRIIGDKAAETITKFGGRSKVLNILIGPQLAVREVGSKFEVFVVDQVTGQERLGVSLADMCSSAEFAGAFDARPSTLAKLVNNPWQPETKDLTQQALLLRRNPAMAARVRQEAGIR
jgi:hypothetical protein